MEQEAIERSSACYNSYPDHAVGGESKSEDNDRQSIIASSNRSLQRKRSLVKETRNSRKSAVLVGVIIVVAVSIMSVPSLFHFFRVREPYRLAPQRRI